MKNGLIESFYDNGNILERINYKNDLYDGLSERFHENGDIYYRMNFKNDKRNGLYEYFNKDGSLYVWRYYKNDIEVTDKYIYLGSGEAISKAEWRNKQIDNIINEL